MSNRILFVAAACAAFGVAGAANATTVNWADWTAQPTATHVDGTITAGSDTVGVSYDGSIRLTQFGGGGDTDYWVDLGYTQGVVNRPTGTDLIELKDAGQKTITFSEAVVDPYLAFTSWNGNHVTFSAPFSIISQGCGFWGCGTFATFGGNTGFDGAGEVHGVLQFHGTFTSLSFTDSSEDWHGFTVGIGDIANGVPEPAAWALMILGFGGVGASLRSRRKLATA